MTASRKRDSGSVPTQWVPQVRHSRRSTRGIGDMAMIGTRGRSRATRLTVVPDWVWAQMA